MIDKLFGGDVFVASTRALDAYALRHEAIANNLANVNTPGYKRQDVRFEDQLSDALAHKGGSASHAMSNVRPTLTTVNSTSQRSDGNNIDMEAENIDLATNTLRFETISQQVAGYFGGLKSVINGR